MRMQPPDRPKVYHIVHVDRLASIVADGGLLSDADMVTRQSTGTAIGMNEIKQRRLTLTLASYPTLRVGQCVPFYFCPRSVMLYLICKANHPNLSYRGGQGPILHLEADLHAAVRWASTEGLRWAFTLSNAGAHYFEDRSDLASLNEINWDAVQATKWSGPGIDSSYKDGKQAEFLVERRFPWHLVERIGAVSDGVARQATLAMGHEPHRPAVEVLPDWYY